MSIKTIYYKKRDEPDFGSRYKGGNAMTYSSLYSILLPKIKAKATGILSLRHEDGQNAEIFLSDGVIVGCKNGELSGEAAAGMVAKWLRVDHDFLEGDIPIERHAYGLDEDGYIRLLNEVHRIVGEVNDLLGHNGARLKMHTADYKGNLSLTNSELKVATLLNGKKDIDQVLHEAGMSEFELVYTIHKYHHLGLIKEVCSDEAMADKERALLLKTLTEKLSYIVGPIATVITEEAFESIGTDEAHLGWRDAGKLTDAIAGHLDGEERQAFLGWWHQNPMRSKTVRC